MRVGSNPEKFNNNLKNIAYHRVVIPVFIPNFEGYFKDAFDIFKLNIESLLITSHEKTRITIYNNNCDSTVKEYIDYLYLNEEKVDQVFHSKENLGKINAILSAVKGNLEPLITITDSDVFFKHDWQKQVEQVFIDFPEAGMVSPVPSSKAYRGFTANNWFYGVFKAKIKFHKVLEPDALIKFDESLGKEISLYNQQHLEKYLVLENKKSRAVMGCGHFVATLKREVIDLGSFEPAYIKIQGGVENKFIDIPNENLGFLRLATLGNYAYHLGNVKEDWMFEEFEKLKSITANKYTENNNLFQSKNFYAWQTILGKIISKMLLNKKIKIHYFNFLGLKNGHNY